MTVEALLEAAREKGISTERVEAYVQDMYRKFADKRSFHDLKGLYDLTGVEPELNAGEKEELRGIPLELNIPLVEILRALESFREKFYRRLLKQGVPISVYQQQLSDAASLFGIPQRPSLFNRLYVRCVQEGDFNQYLCIRTNSRVKPGREVYVALVDRMGE